VITDSFLNSCYTLILNKNLKLKHSPILYRDIKEILDASASKETIQIPITFKNKLECLTKIIEMLLDGRTIDNIIDSISFSEKYKQYQEFIEFKMEEKITDAAFQDIIKQIRLRKKVNSLFKNYDQLHKVVDSIREGTFESLDDITDDYETTIKQLYTNVMDENRSVRIEASSSLDLRKDDYSHVVSMIQAKYSNVNTTSTGFDIIDHSMPGGGFEPSRLYIFGGGSGAGKSTLINNMIYRAAIDPTIKIDDTRPALQNDEIRNVYLYVTMENTIEESLLRTYQPMFDKDSKQVLMDFKDPKFDMKKDLFKKFRAAGSTIIMKYFPAMTVSPLDITGVIDDAINEYGKESIKGLYIDYLDLLKTDIKYDMYRLELGHITLSLKSLAVQYNIPVITASQLGRSVYRVKDAEELNLDFMSESIKKVEHADFVMLLAKSQFKPEGSRDLETVHAKIGKNRNGQSGTSIDFTVNFSKFKFIQGSYPQKKTVETCSSLTIEKFTL
jgi:replicative DNA helicase